MFKAVAIRNGVRSEVEIAPMNEFAVVDDSEIDVLDLNSEIEFAVDAIQSMTNVQFKSARK